MEADQKEAKIPARVTQEDLSLSVDDLQELFRMVTNVHNLMFLVFIPMWLTSIPGSEKMLNLKCKDNFCTCK